MYFESSLHIVANLSSVIESKKTRMTKYAQPATLLIKKAIGENRLESLIMQAFTNGKEEAKDS